MPFQLENGTDLIGLESVDQLWLENDTPSGGIKWPRCCCAGGCSQDFRISCATQLLGGITVNVYVNNGGALLATGTTGTSQNVVLNWTGSCDVYVTAVSAGTTIYANSLSLVSGQITTIGITSGVDVVCCSHISLPKQDLQFTSSQPGCTPSSSSGTFIYSAGSWSYTFGFYTITCNASHVFVFTATPWALCVVPLTILSNDPFSAQVVLTPTNCETIAGSGCTEWTWTWTL